MERKDKSTWQKRLLPSDRRQIDTQTTLCSMEKWVVEDIYVRAISLMYIRPKIDVNIPQGQSILIFSLKEKRSRSPNIMQKWTFD